MSSLVLCRALQAWKSVILRDLLMEDQGLWSMQHRGNAANRAPASDLRPGGLRQALSKRYALYLLEDSVRLFLSRIFCFGLHTLTTCSTEIGYKSHDKRFRKNLVFYRTVNLLPENGYWKSRDPSPAKSRAGFIILQTPKFSSALDHSTHINPNLPDGSTISMYLLLLLLYQQAS